MYIRFEKHAFFITSESGATKSLQVFFFPLILKPPRAGPAGSALEMEISKILVRGPKNRCSSILSMNNII